MNLNRFRKLAGLPLIESIADNPEDNEMIEFIMAQEGLTPDQQSKYLDALEVLKNAGKNGLVAPAWVSAYKALRSDDDAKDIVIAAAKLFYNKFVYKNGSVYYWDTAVPEENEDGIDDFTRQAVTAHVDLTYDLIKACEDMDTVSIRSLSRLVMNRMHGVDPVIAQQVALQFLDAHRGMFKPLGDGVYEVNILDKKKPRGTTDYSSMFKDIANKAAKDQ